MSGLPLARRLANNAPVVRLAVLFALVGGPVLTVVGVRDALWPGILGGGFLFFGGVQLHLLWFARRRPGMRVRRALGADGVELRVGLRPHRPGVLLSAAATGVLLVGSSLTLVESPIGRALLWSCLPLPLLLVPDSARGLMSRDRCLVLTPTSVTYRGWSYDLRVRWEEIAGVGFDASDPYMTCIRVDLRPGVTARPVPHKLLFWVEPKPRIDRFQVPTIALDLPAQLAALVGAQSRMPAETRSTILAEHGVAMLSGQGQWA